MGSDLVQNPHSAGTCPAGSARGDGVEVRVQDGTIWLSQKSMGELFMTSSDNVGLHLKNIFNEGELNAASVAEEFSVTAADGRFLKRDFDTFAALEKRDEDKRNE